MARQLIQLPGFNGVGYSQTASSNLGVGNVIYDWIALTIKKAGALVTLANLDTDVAEIRVVADSGKILRRFTPALLLQYLNNKSLQNALSNAAAGNTCSVYLPFVDPTRPTVEGQEATALGTADVKQLKIEVDFLNPAGANPVYAVTGIAAIRIGAKSVRFLETWQMESFNLVNGVANFNTLSTVDDYLGLIILSATATRVRVTVDTNIVLDQYKADAEAALRSYREDVITAASFPIMWDFTRQLSDALPMTMRGPDGSVIARVSTFNIEVTDTVAATVKALRRNLWLG